MNRKRLTEQEKRNLLKDALGARYSSVGNNYPTYSKVIDKLGTFNDIATIAELLPGINSLMSGSAVSSVLGSASFLGVLLFPISQTINLINANQTGHKLYSYRCIAYTITAWSFKKPIPQKSQRILRNMSSGVVVQSAKTIQEFNQIWQKTSVNLLPKLRQLSTSNKMSPEVLQALFQSIADNDPNKLCLEILKSFEPKLSFSEKLVWKSNYKIRYGE